MENLPDEIILHIISFLEPQDHVTTQRLTRRFLSLGRDNTLWKIRCFEHSKYETNRLRQQLLSAQEPNHAALRRAINASSLAGAAQSSLGEADPTSSGLGVFTPRPKLRDDSIVRAMTNWDPSYPSEKTNYYQEFIHRHAPIALNWLQEVRDITGGTTTVRESMGIGVLEYGATKMAEKLIAPLDDGSVNIWDVSPDYSTRGHCVARSAPGTLFERTPANTLSMNNETGAVDNVSVDSVQQKAYIAIAQNLHELDLNTLQVVQRQAFPFSITALSAVDPHIPITVGTNMTLHLYDPRAPRRNSLTNHTTHCELIGGTLPKPNLSIPTINTSKAVSLSQPGPLSILHLPITIGSPSLTDPIWVAGRFTSLLTYDRRFWPRISSTLFSGARLSSLTYLPYPFVPRALHDEFSPLSALRAAKYGTGSTLIAAGEYKGKGSLELYATPRCRSNNCVDATAQEYRNRHTLSKSRLLSVAAHGTRFVFSDGDGNLKWVERDGTTFVRSFNINDHDTRRASASGTHVSPQPRSNLFGHDDDGGVGGAPRSEDIVQKIIATNPAHAEEAGQRNDLLVWTGEGRLGMVGFGHEEIVFGEDGEERVEAEEERRYAFRMREALERQADETRFVRGLGFGFAFA